MDHNQEFSKIKDMLTKKLLQLNKKCNDLEKKKSNLEEEIEALNSENCILLNSNKSLNEKINVLEKSF
jgi:hypothetical protein